MNVDGVFVEIHQNDLPSSVAWGHTVAVDTETMGLNYERDRLCLIQLYGENGACHFVQFPKESWDDPKSRAHVAPNLRALFSNSKIVKLFHFARFDVAVLLKYLDVSCSPIYCTKIASKLVRTNTDRHSLRELCGELLGIELKKAQQSSDWGRATLTEEQIHYAAHDVLHLHQLREKLDALLEREGRNELAYACFQFLPDRARLDVSGWSDVDIFAY